MRSKRESYECKMIKIKFILIVLTLLLFNACVTQPSIKNSGDSSNNPITAPSFTSPIDSLEWVCNHSDLPVKMRLKACNKLSFDLVYADVNKAKSYALKGIELGDQAKLDSLKGYFLSTLGMVYEVKSVRDSAKIYFQQALLHAIEKRDHNLESFSYLGLGLIHANMNQYEQSAEYYEKALKISEEKGYKGRYSTILQNIGITYLKMSNYERAEHYFLKAKEMFIENSYSEGLAHVYLNMGIMYSELNRIAEAREILDESLKIFQSVGNRSAEALVLMNQSRLFAGDKKYHQAMELARKSLVLAEESGYPYVIKNALSEISHLYGDMGNYKLSEEYALKEMGFIDSTEITELWILYKQLIPIYVKQGKKEDAIQTFEKYDSLTKVVNSTQVQSTYNELEVKYETAKKEFEIERQQQVIVHQNTQRWFLVSGIAVCILILGLLWYMLRLRNRRNAALTERNDTLSEMNATKDKFFSIISHDLRNPAIAQRNSLKLLVESGRLWDVDRLATFYHHLLNSAEGQVELLYNLLGWAQVQTGRITFRPETFLFSDLRSDLSLIRKIAEGKGVAFDIQLPDHALVTGDRNMLAIVIRNLLTNAIKFTAKGGTVSLLMKPSGNEKHMVTICDTGTGMSPEQVQNLFRIDRQQSHKGTEGEEGSGLGLIVCKELVEKHGSVLQVESEKGVGSRFWFEI